MIPVFKLLRAKQWTKNAVCLAGPVFGGTFMQPRAVGLAAATGLTFCFVSSAAYVWNDIHDRRRDRLHPKKCLRPVASGEVSVRWAALVAASLGISGLAAGLALGGAVFACLALYIANNLLYNAWLKHLVLWDVMSIVFGFVLRLCAGIYVVGDIPTTWILLCSFFLAAFLGFSKRRAELSDISGDAADDPLRSSRRPVLDDYSVDYLDFLLSSSATMAIMSYALFTTTSGKNPSLVITIPIVYYAIMHYKRLVMIGKQGEEPELVLLKDVHIIVCVAAWLLLYMFLMQTSPAIVR